MTRRSIFATLLAPLLARFAPKAKAEDLSDWTVTVETGLCYEMPLRPGLCRFVELPAPITALQVHGDHLFAFTETGMFEIVEDDTLQISQSVDVADFEMAVRTREITLEEFRRRYQEPSPGTIMSISAAKRRSLKPSQFGLPGDRKFPVDTRGRAVAAKGRATQAVKAGRMSPSTANKIKAKANRVLGHSNIRNARSHAGKLASS